MFLFCKEEILLLLFVRRGKSPGKSWNSVESAGKVLELWCKKSWKNWKKVLESPGIRIIFFLVGTMVRTMLNNLTWVSWRRANNISAKYKDHQLFRVHFHSFWNLTSTRNNYLPYMYIYICVYVYRYTLFGN